jgi:hypothetical protein
MIIHIKLQKEFKEAHRIKLYKRGFDSSFAGKKVWQGLKGYEMNTNLKKLLEFLSLNEIFRLIST